MPRQNYPASRLEITREICQLLAEHARSEFPARADCEDLCEILFELLDYDAAVVGYGQSAVAGHYPDASENFRVDFRSSLSAIECSDIGEIESARSYALTYADRLDRMVLLILQGKNMP